MRACSKIDTKIEYGTVSGRLGPERDEEKRIPVFRLHPALIYWSRSRLMTLDRESKVMRRDLGSVRVIGKARVR